MFVWFVYATKSQRATAQSHAAILSSDEVARQKTKSRDKITGLTSVLSIGLVSVCLSVCLSLPQSSSKDVWALRRRSQRTFQPFCPTTDTPVN